MHYIALLPGIFVFWYARKYGSARGLIDVYIPIVWLLPDGLRAMTPGLPDPTIAQSCAIGLTIACFKNGDMRKWVWTRADPAIGLLMFIISISEYRATNYSDAQNLIFGQITSLGMPYIFGKMMIEQPGMRIELCRRIAYCAAIVVILSAYEVKMAQNLWTKYFAHTFFPGQYQWGITFRHGLARLAGPYGHSIVAGMMMGMAYRFHQMCASADGYPKYFKYGPKGSVWFTQARIMTIIMIAGCFFTVARGPWIGAFAGGILVIYGASKNRKRITTGLILASIFLGIPGGKAFYDYTNVDFASAKDASQESAAYRKQLFEKYTVIANEKPWIGWGLQTWPKVRGMASIDNHFLLVSLQHGYTTLLLQLYLMFGSAIACMKFAKKIPYEQGGDKDPAWGLGSFGFMTLVSLGTVSLAEQAIPMFYLTVGWTQAYLYVVKGSRHAEKTAKPVQTEPDPIGPFRIRRALT